MDASNYVGVSGLLALERRLTTLAHNVANANTPGFRAEEITFKALVSETAEPLTAYASTGDSFLSRNTGPIQQTGNPLDVAIKGNAWFAIQTPGGLVYTRDGRLEMGADGGLRSVAGYEIVDASGGALRLDPNGGPPKISGDGMITQAGKQVGALGLFMIPENAKLERFENSGVKSSLGAEPVLEFNANGVVQGHLEGANVNPVMELTRLIAVSRTFEAMMTSVSTNLSTEKTAIRTLGPSG